MNEMQILTSNEIANEVVPMTPIAIAMVGKTLTDKKLDLVSQGLTNATAAALSNVKGKVGTAIRAGFVDKGVVDSIRQAANGQYRSILEQYVFHIGVNITIKNPAEFRSMPFAIEQMIVKERMSKNGGVRIDPKTGVEMPTAKVAAMLHMQQMFEAAIEQADEIKAADAARRAAKQLEANKLAEEAGVAA